MLLDSGAIALARALLDAATFHYDRHGQIFAAICALNDRSEPVDLVTVSAELSRRGDLAVAGGPQALASIMEWTTMAANVGPHAARILEACARRRLVRISLDAQTRAADVTTDLCSLVADLQRGCADARVMLARAEVARHAR
jgi:replicative DNA helicase